MSVKAWEVTRSADGAPACVRAAADRVRFSAAEGAAGGKYVLVEFAGESHFAFAHADDCEYHAHIVELLAAANGQTGTWNERQDRYTSDDESVWRVHGGGRWEWLPGSDVIRLWGRSLAYGPLDHREAADAVRRAGGVFGRMTYA